MTILVCDDDKEIVDAIEIYLQQEGYQIYKAYDGEQAIKVLKEMNIQLLIIDIMMPRLDGIHATLKIREFSSVPIIFLSAKSEDTDKILGLNMGADDYITKPFNILEVKARIKAIMRRTTPKQKEAAKVIEDGDLKLYCDDRRAFVAGREMNLTAREFDVLELLVLNPNKVYSRESLLKLIWGNDYPGDVRTVDVHIRRLREKIESKPSDPKYIHTKWGVGYYYS
mgnify:CR=1 FL=1